VRKKDESGKSLGSIYHLTHFTVTVLSPEVKVTKWRKSGRVWKGAVRDEGSRHQKVVSIW